MGEGGWIKRERAMLTHCIKHTFESSAGECRTCHNAYCQRCLVYPFGPKKPPYCVACAIGASGVRLNAGARPAPAAAAPLPAPVEDRRSMRARKKAERLAAKNTTLPPPPPPPAPADLPSDAIPPMGMTAAAHHQL